MTKKEAKNIVKGITDKIESTTDIDDWAEFWGFTREDYEEFLEMSIKALEQESILDKIRAEIEKEMPMGECEEDYCYAGGLDKALEIIDKYKEGEEKEMKVRMLEDIDKEEISKSVVLLDLFTKTYCRYPSDYDRFNDLKFRCDECPFYKDNADCLVKIFKNKYAPDYRDFGSMGDL